MVNFNNKQSHRINAIIKLSGVNTETVVAKRPSALEAELVYFTKNGYDHSTYNNKLNSLEDALMDAKSNGISCQLDTVGGYIDTTQTDELDYANDFTHDNELVLEIRDFNRNQATLYTYSGTQAVAVSTNASFNTILSGQRNTVEGIIDVQGRVTVQEYSPYGSTLSNVNQNSVTNKLGFNGELEEGHNIQYLRARYYMHDNDRFISQDTVHGAIGDVQSHILYNYVEGNPVNAIDPTGHDAGLSQDMKDKKSQKLTRNASNSSTLLAQQQRNYDANMLLVKTMLGKPPKVLLKLLMINMVFLYPTQ